MGQPNVYYHATPKENMNSIVMNGLTASRDGMVHISADEKQAARYCAARGDTMVAMFSVEVDDPDRLVEIEDSEGISYGYPDDVPKNKVRAKAFWDLTKIKL